jgi:hypothetical protein
MKDVDEFRDPVLSAQVPVRTHAFRLYAAAAAFRAA